MTDRGTNTLAAHGQEELFFQLCCCVNCLVSGGKQVLVLLTYVSRVQYSCGIVLVFGSGRKQCLVLHTYLMYNTLVRLCQFFVVVGNSVVAGNSSQNENTFTFHMSSFYEKSVFGYFIMIRQPMCVFRKINTLLLCIFLFCIFLLYRTDPQVEVRIRILLKEAAIVSKM